MPRKKRNRRFAIPAIIRIPALILSLLMLCVFSLLYSCQPDAYAAISYLPVWLWAAPGLFFAFLTFTWRRKWRGLALIALWILYLGVFAEEPRSLLRRPQIDNPTWQAARFEGRGIRVVTINCGAEETVAAAEEVRSYLPDLVLLQEAPDLPAIRRLSKLLFGYDASIAYFPDRAIIARGEIRRIRAVRQGGMLQARVKLTGGPALEVFCVHFISPARRKNILATEYLQEQARRRHVRMKEMEAVVEAAARIPYDVPLLIGGDFNAPHLDPVYRLLTARLTDTFAVAGTGWPNTVLNTYPIFRIDRIWTTSQLKPVSVTVHQTRHSDHRLVVCDLMVTSSKHK